MPDDLPVGRGLTIPGGELRDPLAQRVLGRGLRLRVRLCGARERQLDRADTIDPRELGAPVFHPSVEPASPNTATSSAVASASVATSCSSWLI